MSEKKTTTTTGKKAETTTPAQRYKGWDMSRVFWGLLLVLLGGLLLLSNFGLIELQLNNLWQLWPLLIVAWGVSLLNIKGTWWKLVSAILLIASLGLFVLVAIGAGPFANNEQDSQMQSQQIEIDGSDVDRLNVSVKAGAGNVTIGSQESELPVEAVLQSDFATLDVDSQTEGSTQTVEVSVDGERSWWGGNFRNDLDVQLSRELPVALSVDTGASDFEADLSSVKLERLAIDLGASSGMVTLGDLVDRLDVNVKAGASSVTIRVPKDAGVRVTLEQGVSSQDLDNLQEKGEGLYETSEFEKATKQITIKADIGVASFELERY